MKVALCILDGCNTKAFEKVVNRSPNDSFFGPLKSGFYDHSVTSFPTVTAPEHATLMTGCYPRKHGIAGMEWYYREKDEYVDYFFLDNLEMGKILFGRENILKKIWGLIRGFQSFADGLVDFAVDLNENHLSDDVKTIFEILNGESTVSIKEFITRGVKLENSIFDSVVESLSKFKIMDFDDYLSDKYKENIPVFMAYWKAGTDTKSHEFGPSSSQLEKEIEAGLKRASDIVKFYQAKNEEVLLIITADHAQSVVTEFPNFTRILSRNGLRVDKYEKMSEKTDAILVNNGRMFYLYLTSKGDRQNLIRRFVEILRAEISVDLIFYIDENDEIIVVDTSGTEWELSKYRWDSRLYPSTDERFPSQPIYPNAITRIENIIRSKRAGDIIVSMKEGFSSHRHKGDHGSLMAKDSVVPLLIRKFGPNSSVSDPPAKLNPQGLLPNSVDVAPTLLKLLGHEHEKADGKPITRVMEMYGSN
jgi:hypothetical protein